MEEELNLTNVAPGEGDAASAAVPAIEPEAADLDTAQTDGEEQDAGGASDPRQRQPGETDAEYTARRTREGREAAAAARKIQTERDTELAELRKQVASLTEQAQAAKAKAEQAQAARTQADTTERENREIDAQVRQELAQYANATDEFGNRRFTEQQLQAAYARRFGELQLERKAQRLETQLADQQRQAAAEQMMVRAEQAMARHATDVSTIFKQQLGVELGITAEDVASMAAPRLAAIQRVFPNGVPVEAMAALNDIVNETMAMSAVVVALDKLLRDPSNARPQAAQAALARRIAGRVDEVPGGTTGALNPRQVWKRWAANDPNITKEMALKAKAEMRKQGIFS